MRAHISNRKFKAYHFENEKKKVFFIIFHLTISHYVVAFE